MCKSPCKRKSLRLSARKAHTAAAYQSIGAVFHIKNLTFQRNRRKILRCVPGAAAKNIVFHRVGEKLRVVTEIADR